MHLCFKQISKAYLSSETHYILRCTTLISQNSLFILSNKASFGLHSSILYHIYIQVIASTCSLVKEKLNCSSSVFTFMDGLSMSSVDTLFFFLQDNQSSQTI